MTLLWTCSLSTPLPNCVIFVQISEVDLFDWLSATKHIKFVQISHFDLLPWPLKCKIAELSFNSWSLRWAIVVITLWFGKSAQEPIDLFEDLLLVPIVQMVVFRNVFFFCYFYTCIIVKLIVQ